MKILLVEDEPAIAETIRFALAREGYESLYAETGADGLQMLHEHAPDLIILDVGLPDTSGFEVCKQIRAHSEVPVIFLTAQADEIDRVVGLEIGADDYVAKPFSPRELVARVKVILKRVRGNAAQEPSVRATAQEPVLVIDPERVEARLLGERLDLTRYEFALLAMLAGHPGRVFSREQILDQIWPAPVASGDRTVDAHVKTLRAKLREVAPELEIIRTHRGLGYSLADLN